MMKRILLIPALAAALSLAACNTAQEDISEEKDTVDTPAVTEVQTTDTETPEKTEPVVEEGQVTTTEQPTTEEVSDAVSEVKIYKSDENAENIILSDTKSYSFKQDGPVTTYILTELGLTDYYNKHTVSADEKTIMLDFKEDIQFSNLVQGSTGGWILAGEIYASFFNTLPQLENLQLRVNGKEVEMDHISFTGTITREDFTTAYPSVTK